MSLLVIQPVQVQDSSVQGVEHAMVPRTILLEILTMIFSLSHVHAHTVPGVRAVGAGKSRGTVQSLGISNGRFGIAGSQSLLELRKEASAACGMQQAVRVLDLSEEEEEEEEYEDTCMQQFMAASEIAARRYAERAASSVADAAHAAVQHLRGGGSPEDEENEEDEEEDLKKGQVRMSACTQCFCNIALLWRSLV